jgi:hypothetical protein
MATPIPSYNRVPPPNDPDSHPLHLDNELGKLERTTASLITTVSAIPDIYAPLISPTFTGSPAAPTASTGDNSTLLATTAFVKNQAYATLASPALTGSPTAPTASQGDNSTKLATTAYVDRQAVWTTVPKTTATTITSNTTYADDPELKFAMAANSTYAFRIYHCWTNLQQGQFAVNGPAGLVSLRVISQSSGVTPITAYNTVIGGPAVGTTLWETFGIVQNGATAGTFAFRIAQFASSANTTIIEKGGWLEWTKLA